MSQATCGRRQRLPMIAVSIIASFAVVACSSTDHRAGAPATTAPSVKTPSASKSSPRSSPTTAAATTSPPTTSASTTDPTQPNGATQARLHVVLTDLHGPNTDLFVNGAVAVNGGQEQVNVPVGYVTAYLYVPPGTHQVALTPTGQGLAQALIAPLDVPMVAGHRYLVAFMGQIADKSLKPLVIDETKAAADVGASPSDPVTITLNDLVGATNLSYEWAGEIVNADIPFGGFAAGIYRAGGGHVKVTAKGTNDTVLIDEDNYVVPGDSVFGFFGPDATAPDGLGVVDSAPTSELSLIDYLRTLDPEKLIGPSGETPSFHTVLGAIETTGLTEMYSAATPLLFVPPTDQAFADMPAAERDELLADPTALANLLRAHTIDAYVPRGSLTTTSGVTPCCAFNRSFTNLVGDTINIGNDFSVNGAGGGFASTWLANGTQIHPVGTVIFPPAPLPASGAEQPSNPGAAETEIRANLSRLYELGDPVTPVEPRLALLDDPHHVREALDQANAAATFTDQASVRVTIDDIVFLSPTEATFHYDMHTSAGDFAGQVGGARLIDGVWKITRATYCQDIAKASGVCGP